METIEKLRVLNCYCGVGGNRKYWDKEHTGLDLDITAVELNPQIAKIYQDFFPQDKVIVADAHQYLLEHYHEFEFIWSSPPCQSHSKIRMMASKAGSYDAIFPDMNLWSEIIFLQHFSKSKWVVENVYPYYKPLVELWTKLGRHLFWSNFNISIKDFDDGLTHNERGMSHKGIFDLLKYKIDHRKDQLIRNSVLPELGLHILNESKRNIQPELFQITKARE
jgi:DNA (cytosine-5)-methyltransferase 1